MTKQPKCSFPMELRAKAIEAREDTDLCALLMAAATELERLRRFTEHVAAINTIEAKALDSSATIICSLRDEALHMLKGVR